MTRQELVRKLEANVNVVMVAYWGRQIDVKATRLAFDRACNLLDRVARGGRKVSLMKLSEAVESLAEAAKDDSRVEAHLYCMGMC